MLVYKCKGARYARTVPVASPPARLSQRERRAQILRAAAAAFARGGFAGTSMEDVASEAGITRLIVYRHFASKEELYRAVLERVAGRLRDEFHEGREAAREGYGFAVGSILAVAREDPAGFRLLTGHAVREPRFVSYHDAWWAAAVDAARALLGDTVAAVPGREWAARTLVAFLVDAVDAWLEAGDPAADALFVGRATAGAVAMVVAWSRVAGDGRAGPAAPSAL
jgi:AcrR family transcriptional regulator